MTKTTIERNQPELPAGPFDTSASNSDADDDLEPFGMGALGGPQWNEVSEADAQNDSAMAPGPIVPTARFDLEQDIFKCWHIVDDIDHLLEMIMDRDTSKDNIANVLAGLSVLYEDRFQRLMDKTNDPDNQPLSDNDLKRMKRTD
jgi:hypothetical protein